MDLPSPVTLLTPNSGQIWVAGTTQDINYTSSANVNIKLSIDSGSTWCIKFESFIWFIQLDDTEYTHYGGFHQDNEYEQ